jgi:L-alanine-DL-glutamate epimerase-like enolase superfamily enzyme
MSWRPLIEGIEARAYRVPTERPEADGTLSWDATELVLVLVRSGGVEGLGYSYTHGSAAAALIRDRLAPGLHAASALDPPQAWQKMNAALRNIGRPGLGLMALAAVDIALWDLKARLLQLSLSELWGHARLEVPVYGSGGFTSYTDAELQAQLGDWAAQGITAMKMKVGSQPRDDVRRVRLAREAVGAAPALMVDANGAYDQTQALQLAQHFADCGVCWFEEPLSSDDLAGLQALRRRLPPGMALAAGEYGWDAGYFRRMLEAQAVDVLQVDATRCGYTGFLHAAALCDSFGMPLSAHCAPALHAPVCLAVPRLLHLEYFHDHQRLESMLFDGLPLLRDGALRLLESQHGHGLKLRQAEAERYRME